MASLRSKSSFAGCALLAVAAGWAAPAFAVETIVVTAERVEEDLQKVPLAVTAFSEDQIRNGNIQTWGDLALRTPGFTASAINPAQPNFYIRGIGSAEGVAQNAGGDPSVVMFFDGIYVGRGGIADIDAYDLQRIEVLRGPQGTLFGKNAVGGLVQFISKKANDQDALSLGATVGDYGRIDVHGHANVALTDNLFFAAGASAKHRNGFEYNETTGNRVDDLNLWTTQGQLRYLPNRDVEVILAADYTKQDQKGQPRHNICDTSFAGGVHCVGINPDPRVVDAYTDGYIRRGLTTLRGEVNWDTGLGMLTSITGYRHVDLDYLTPFFSNPVNPPAQIESTEIDHEKDKQFSEELRLAFDTLNGAVDGQVGFYYLHEDNDRIETLIQQFPAPFISGIGAFPQSVSARSTAVFGQANWHVLENLTVTAGARMTWETKSGDFAGILVAGPGLPPPLAAPYAVHASKSWEAFTPRAAVNYLPADNIMLYVSASRGFKSGGFQGIAGTGISAATPYNPEFAWSYEGGVKTTWWDDRVRLNASIFKTDYKDLQISQLIALVGVVIGNAATARVKGAELEFAVQPDENWQLDGSYSYLDARYVSFAPGSTINFPGNYLTRSPKNKANVGLQFTHPVGDWTGLARVDFVYSDKYFFDPNNIPTQTQKAYSMWDARIALSAPEDKWSVSVWGKNLGNTLVANYVTAFAPYHQVLVPYAPPRTVGISLTFND